MKTNLYKISQHWGRFTLLILIAVTVVACVASEPTPEPTSVPTATVAPTATTAPAESTPEEPASADEAQPESPLSQPESPLTTTVSKPRTEEDATALAAITTAPDPAEGFGTLAGVLYSFGIVPGAVPGTAVYLEAADEVDGKFYPPSISLGPDTEKGDIVVNTNDIGQIQMEVPPGHYYMSVWTIYNWLLVVETIEEETPRLITVEEGDQLDLGVLYVNWP